MRFFSRRYGKSFIRIAAVCLLSAMLCGCAQNSNPLPAETAVLPPARLSFEAPVGQMDAQRETTVQLYLPSPDGTRLMAVTRRITVDPYRHHADELVNALFAYDGEEAQTLPRANNLTLLTPIEVSSGSATVNLSAQALNLSHEELYVVFQSVTNTLCSCASIESVNLLIAGVQPGLDVSSETPAGALHLNHTDDMTTLWSRALSQRNAADGTRRLTQNVTLYFPAAGGMGILCENRTLAFSQITLPHMASVLLDALSEGPKVLFGVPTCPPLGSFLTTEPAVNEVSGERVLTLHFAENFGSALLEKGITRSCMAAALTYTLTTYLPGIAGVEMYIGQEKVQSVTPEGTYQGAGETIYFQNGVMRRQQFSFFLLSQVKLYFALENGMLQKVYRAVPWYEAPNAYSLLLELIRGPQYYDAGSRDVSAVMPLYAAMGDVLGVSHASPNTALVNFTARFHDLCRDMTPREEQLMVYAMVNTLTELEGVWDVCFFVNGTQPDHFASTVSLPGIFMRNPDITAT